MLVCTIQFKDNISGRNRKGEKTGLKWMIEPGRHWGIWHLRHLGLVLCMYVCTYLFARWRGQYLIPPPTPSSLIRSSAHYICRFYLLPYFQTNRLKVCMKFPRKYTREKKKSTWIGNSRTCICYCSNIYQVTPAIIIISTYQIFQNPQRKFKKKKKSYKRGTSFSNDARRCDISLPPSF